jgi:hypothetical protein
MGITKIESKHLKFGEKVLEQCLGTIKEFANAQESSRTFISEIIGIILQPNSSSKFDEKIKEFESNIQKMHDRDGKCLCSKVVGCLKILNGLCNGDEHYFLEEDYREVHNTGNTSSAVDAEMKGVVRFESGIEITEIENNEELRQKFKSELRKSGIKLIKETLGIKPEPNGRTFGSTTKCILM